MTHLVESAEEGPWTFTLNYPRPLPGMSLNSRNHWRVRHDNTQIIRAQVMRLVRAMHLGELERIRVNITWHVPNRRARDSDNLAPWCKAIYDGIGSNKGVSARVVPDDSGEYLERPEPQIVYTRGCKARFEVTITDLS